MTMAGPKRNTLVTVFIVNVIFFIALLDSSRAAFNVIRRAHGHEYQPFNIKKDKQLAHHHGRDPIKSHLHHQRREHRLAPHERNHNTNSYNRRQDNGVSRHNRHTFGMHFPENLLHNTFPSFLGNSIFHPTGNPFLRSTHPLHSSPNRWMERLTTQIEHHIDRLTDQLTSSYRPKHFPQSNHHQGIHHLPSRYQDASSHHTFRPNKYTSSDNLRIPSTSKTGRDYRNSLSYHPKGRHQYKILENSLEKETVIPEDVEVFQPQPTPSPPTPPIFKPNIPSIFREMYPTYFDNCTRTHGGPFHHSVFKSTTASNGQDHLTPFHSLGHHISSIVTSSQKNPFGVSHSIQSTLRHHQVPRKPYQIPKHSFHPYSDLLKHPIGRVIDSIFAEEGNPSLAIFPSTKLPKRTKINVEEHLNVIQPSNHIWSNEGDEIPCIKCPPDTHVEAPRGTDCVLANPPSPLSCTSRTLPEVKTIVTEGPAPGTILPEGHYSMVITILTSDASTTTPITTCKVNYDVEVRKCPELPDIAEAKVTCTAGRAWGSRCTWTCAGERILHGASVTTCSGHTHLRWSRPPPTCVDPPSKTPERIWPLPPQQGGRCPSPPEVEGGHFICHTPTEEFPRRDLIPKDDPNVSTGAIEPVSAALTLALHPIGTVCKVECTHGRVIKISDSVRTSITCMPSLSWDQRPPQCYPKVGPEVRPGDCEDTILTYLLNQHKVEALQHPISHTTSGDLADVTCNVQEIEPGYYYVRTCTAWDPELQMSATCQHTITSNISEKKCLDLFAPDNGDLLCREDENGDTLCEIICNEGFQAPLAFTRCPHNSRLWDFQVQEGYELPPCIPAGSRQRPKGKPTRPGNDETDAQFPKNTRFKTVADVFEDKVKKNFLLNTNDPDEGQQIPREEKQRGYDEIDKHVTAESIPETSKENLDLDDDGVDYYYDGLEDNEDENHYYDEDADFDYNSKNVPLKRERVRTHSFESKSKGPKNSQADSEGMVINSADIVSVPSYDNSLASHKTMPKMMEDDTSNLFSSLHEAHPYGRPINAHNIKETHTRDEGNNKPSYHHNDINKFDSGNIHREQHLRSNQTPQEYWHENNHKSITPNNTNPLSHRNTDMVKNRELEDKEGDDEAAVMKAILELEVLVDECSSSKEALEALTKLMMEQEACRNLKCHVPLTTCRNESTNEGVVKIKWVVGGPYQPLDDYYYDDLQVPMVETVIESLVVSTERLIASERLTRTLEEFGAAIDLTSFTLSHLDLLCTRPSYNFDPASNRCQKRRQ